MYVIEFFGLPGSGKTTVSSLLKKGLKKKGFYILDVEEAFYYCIAQIYNRRFFSVILKFLDKFNISYKILRIYFNRFVLGPKVLTSIKKNETAQFIKKRPELVRLILEQIEAIHSTERFRGEIREWFYEFIGWDHLFRSHLPTGAIVVTDEWFIHEALCSMASEQDCSSMEILERYLQLIPTSSVVVYVESELSHCLSRIKSRKTGHKMINQFSEGETMEYLENNEKISKKILSCTQKIIQINNDNDMSVLQENINNHLIQLEKTLPKR